MNKPSKPTKPNANENQRGISVVELLFAAATLGAAILVAAMTDPKLPRMQGD